MPSSALWKSSPFRVRAIDEVYIATDAAPLDCNKTESSASAAIWLIRPRGRYASGKFQVDNGCTLRRSMTELHNNNIDARRQLAMRWSIFPDFKKNAISWHTHLTHPPPELVS